MEGRAGILFTTGDPVLLQWWLRCLPRLQNLGCLYVGIISKLPVEITSLAESMIHYYCWKQNIPCITKLYIHHVDEKSGARIFSHAVNDLLLHVQEPSFTWLEDDGWVLSEDEFNKQIMSVDVVSQPTVLASKRGACSPSIWNKAKELWGLSYEGYGDQGPNFWPFLFTTSKQTLSLTDYNWDSTYWPPDTEIPGLHWYTPTGESADALVSISLQLRSQGCNIITVPQHHINVHTTKDELSSAPWIHFGSLSSFAIWMEEGYTEAQWKNLAHPTLSQELARRIAMYQLMLESYIVLYPYVETDIKIRLIEYINLFRRIHDINDHFHRFYDLYTRCIAPRVIGF